MSNPKTNEKVLGIDLGTTNSAAAIYEGGHATVIPSAEGPTSRIVAMSFCEPRS